MTQKELAEKLGLSQATVSFAMAGRLDKVSQEVAKRVADCASELGYRKSPICTSKKPRLVGLLFAKGSFEGFQERISFETLHGIQKAAKTRNWSLIQHIYEEGDELLGFAGSVSACVVIGGIPASLLPGLAKRVAVVTVNRAETPETIDSVCPDNHGAARRAVLHLHSIGHRRIGFFGISSLGGHHAERLGGYCQAMAELGLLPGGEWIFIPERAEPTEKDTERHVRKALSLMKAMKEPPTALVCPADVYTLAFLRVAKETGLQIPERLSLIGFDDLAESRAEKPSLSSFKNDFETMGALATQLLDERLRDPSKPAACVRCHASMEIRDSVRPPWNRAKRS